MAPEIVQVKIHPAIGIARVGNSESPPFIGPESPDERPLEAGSYKDAAGRIIKQAARFRLYGYDGDGNVVRELKHGEGGVEEIEWSVHLANKKAAWYRFHIPLDIPEAARLTEKQRSRRNADIRGEDRKKLIIDPGKRTVYASQDTCEYFDTGEIMGRRVPLGSICTEGTGRLLVTGGDGKSGSYAGSSCEKKITGVANNDT
ncbi:LodA/GoxA family CTQ-dependent oxidase [Streptomyces sp. NPDC023327]|uniref:LodA/GoxA family CTQ-dependent oxidase n=1 Tax=Streptomyces sp. NPDC023327 TaxID=3157088 RepID=UPI0033F76172